MIDNDIYLLKGIAVQSFSQIFYICPLKHQNPQTDLKYQRFDRTDRRTFNYLNTDIYQLTQI